jgi:hypothetical protein
MQDAIKNKIESFKDTCLIATSHLDYTEELKLSVIEAKDNLEEFEAKGGNEEIYYDITHVVAQIAMDILSNY